MQLLLNFPCKPMPSEITMTAKLVLYISIYFCARLIPLEMSMSKTSSLSKSYVCVFSVQPNSSALYQSLQLLTIVCSTYVCSIARNLWTDRRCWKWSHCIIYTACTCASKPDPFSAIAWTSQSMGQPKLHGETIHHTEKYCCNRAIWLYICNEWYMYGLADTDRSDNILTNYMLIISCVCMH